MKGFSGVSMCKNSYRYCFYCAKHCWYSSSVVVVHPAECRCLVHVSHHHVVSLDLCLLRRQLLALQFQTATTEWGVGGERGDAFRDRQQCSSVSQINTRHRKLATRRQITRRAPPLPVPSPLPFHPGAGRVRWGGGWGAGSGGGVAGWAGGGC